MACFRCGRTSHFAYNCFARTSVYGRSIRTHSLESTSSACFRCGRTNHFANNCFARKSINGAVLDSDSSDECEEDLYYQPKKQKREIARASTFNATNVMNASSAHAGSRAGVYVLKTSTGLYYVGKSRDIDMRILDHRRGLGAACLSDSGGFEVVPNLLTSGSVNDLESWERHETLSRMLTHGINDVRGWIFTSTTMSDSEWHNAFLQICERFDLCRRCGGTSHFADECFAQCRADWVGRITSDSCLFL